MLNKDISLDEFKRIVEITNKGKAVSKDKIPNEALKHLNYNRLLYTFFKLHFTKQRDTQCMA